jgi:AcrR family transcriptional regulator
VAARGRKRNPAIDEAILAATRELLLEAGYANVTMEAVAARAGTTKPSLYLRYPTRAALIFAAVFGRSTFRPMLDTGDIRSDLYEAYRQMIAELAAPEARAAIAGLLAEIASNAELAQLIRGAVIGPEYERARQQLTAAQHRGDIRLDVDLDLIIDGLIGTALVRITMLDHPANDAYAKRLVDLLLDGARPSLSEARQRGHRLRSRGSDQT